MIKRIIFCLGILLAGAVSAFALGPHQVALIVNDDSEDSKTVANAYIALRKIPLENVVYLSDLPDGAVKAPYRFSLNEYLEHIYEPVSKALRERGLNHVSTWLYSVDFPVKIKTGSTADVSLHGITFTQGLVPSEVEVNAGKYVSSLFAGPHMEKKGQLDAARTFDRSIRQKGNGAPLPSMSLGFTGDRGNSVRDVVLCLQRGVMADGTSPRGNIYLIENGNVRTECRKWQFEGTKVALASMNINCIIATNEPSGDPGILGFIDGRMHVKPMAYGKYLPGALAEHLTSNSAVFEDPGHTKCTAWIEAGATASAGAVTEPYAIWTKFPATTIFIFYAQGCSIIESLYQSVRCPLQLYMVGEPLASPWTKIFSVIVVSLKDDPVSGTCEFFSRLTPVPPPGVDIRYRAFIDGEKVYHPQQESTVSVNTEDLSDGYHILRVVAEFGENMVFQSFYDADFVVDNHGRSVSLSGFESGSELKNGKVSMIEVKAVGKPEKVGVCYGTKVLGEHKGDSGRFELSGSELGAGPCKIQAYAVYKDQSRVYSEPVNIKVRK